MERGVFLLVVVLLLALCASGSGIDVHQSDLSRDAVVAPVGTADGLGYTADGAIALPDRDCPSGELFVHHDYSFENAYCWRYEGIQPPYYGAFAEAYYLGPGCVSCGAYWLTYAGGFWPYPADIYVWEDGVTSQPSSVLTVIPGVYFENICEWPFCGQNDVEIGSPVAGEFSLGYWVDFSYVPCAFYCGADLNGPQGNPWTYIAPGQQWPTGWQDPSIVWGLTKSMGIGVYFEPRDPSSVDEFPGGEPPVESPTWGQIKAIFRD
jgi:hypothetical protein